jgi:hypothetical protein
MAGIWLWMPIRRGARSGVEALKLHSACQTELLYEKPKFQSSLAWKSRLSWKRSSTHVEHFSVISQGKKNDTNMQFVDVGLHRLFTPNIEAGAIVAFGLHPGGLNLVTNVGIGSVSDDPINDRPAGSRTARPAAVGRSRAG